MLNAEKFIDLASSLIRLTNELKDIKSQVDANITEINKLREAVEKNKSKIDNLKITEDVCFLGRLTNFNKILLRIGDNAISLGEFLWLLLDYLGVTIDFEMQERKDSWDELAGTKKNYYIIPKLTKK